jgi:hypothetical protein
MHEGGQVAVLKLNRREVDRNLKRQSPGGSLSAGLPENPLTHLNDRAIVFGKGNEDIWSDHPAHRVHPAEQRFKSDDLAANPRQRLIKDRQFILLDRRLQIVLERPALAQLRVHFRFEEANRTTTFTFGSIQRGVGISQKRSTIQSIRRITRDAHAQSGSDELTVDDYFIGHRRLHPLREFVGRCGLRPIRDDNAEFVAAQTSKERAADSQSQAISHFLQQSVANSVSEDVIDLLEAIEIDTENRNSRSVPGCVIQRTGQIFVECNPVGQPGQRIVVCQILNSLPGLLALSDVFVSCNPTAALHRAAHHLDAAPVGKLKILARYFASLDAGQHLPAIRLGITGKSRVSPSVFDQFAK